ncbi:MAG: ATP-binding cassette domain-containing protein [Aureispira sp.]|nr:ATP-binding cassette domain-containing protein [Aureispira sp.]
MLSIKDLKVSYGSQEVLKGLNLEFKPGEVHGILGMNGAGKSTFFHTLYGTKGIDSGECHYNGDWVNYRDIGLLETRPYFYPYMKGKEYIQLLTMHNPKFDIEGWNQLFELPLNQLIDNYSTGMKKKVAFMGMLALDRPILILDEPFNGVDLESNEKIIQILTHLKKQNKIILLSSHIIQALADVADKISYLKDGKIVQTYTQEDFGQLHQLISEMVKLDVDEKIQHLLD